MHYYILTFFAKVHEYNKMVKLHNLMDTAQQLTHFKNYIHSVSKLDQTSTAIDILSADKALDPSATLNVSTMQRPGTHLVVISVRPSNPKPFLQMSTKQPPISTISVMNGLRDSATTTDE